MQSALAQGLMPVVHGDVAFDERLGGTIVSTEEIFSSLASTFPPRAVLIAGIEEGVYQDYPENTTLIPVITPTSFFQSKGQIKGSSVMDVTGGMLDKVTRMVSIVEQHPRVFGQIFSGELPDSILRVLRGEVIGTVIRGESIEELRDIA
jgi:isopentenyl phosphate kinase